MNERIIELATQARKWISTTNFEGMPEDEMTYDEIFQKKFAELIVRECIDTLNGYDVRLSHNSHMALLGQHFGVKE